MDRRMPSGQSRTRRFWREHPTLHCFYVKADEPGLGGYPGQKEEITDLALSCTNDKWSLLEVQMLNIIWHELSSPPLRLHSERISNLTA